MTARFEKNLELFEYKNPRAAALLSCIDVAPQDKIQDSLTDAKEWVKTVDLDHTEVLAVFGIGLGYSYKALSEWILSNSSHQIIFLEDDLKQILLFLESELACEILSNPRVHFYYIEDSHEGLEVLKAISWATFSKKMVIAASVHYSALRADVFNEIKARLLYEASDIHAVCDEYLNYGIAYFRNFWRNLFLLPGSYHGNKLYNSFKGVPAIIVAAGPSLKKHMKLLKKLSNQALIFSGGSSVNALTEANIWPHFGAGIDPNPLQYMRLRQNLAFQVPFFYRSRLLHEAANAISGPRLYLRGGDGYNVAEYFEKKAKIPGRVLGGGHSVANFSIEIAQKLGCSPIILVGFDLAYGEDQQRYAPGIEESHPSSAREIVSDDVVHWKDHQGSPIVTAWKWVLEGQWIEEFAEKHGKRRFINATEGGLGIKGIRHMPLEKVVSRYLKQSYDLDGLVHTMIQQAGVCSCSVQTLYRGMATMFDSLSRCIDHLDALTKLIQENRDVSGGSPMDRPDAIMLIGKLDTELAYQYILEVFDRMKTKFDYYTMQFRSYANQSQNEKTKLEVDLCGYRYFFLKEVCIVNQALIEKTVQEQQNLGKDISSFLPKTTPQWQLHAKK